MNPLTLALHTIFMEMNYDQNESNGKKTLWIIGGIILVVMIIALVYGATQKTLNKADVQADTVTNETVRTQNQSGSVKNSGTTAVLGDVETIELPVGITSLDVVNLQTFPQKVQARVGYSLSGNCAVLDTPTVTVSGKVFTVSLTSRAPKDAPCTKNLVPGDSVVDIPVEGLAAGKYSVKVGKSTKTFTLVADNQIQYSGDK